LEMKEHTHGVGSIITNLQALETVLRYFLMRLRNQEPDFPKIGDPDAKKTYLTRWISLGTLIRNYNHSLDEQEQRYKLDGNVVGIRDAFAHGRLVTATKIPAHLWKFGAARKKGRVKVDFCQELTAEWLNATALMIDSERQKVVDCFKARGYEGLR
jgi:hypothetical protein